MKQAIIFDLDGTLWDSSALVVPIWNRVFERTPGITLRMTEELLGRLMGMTMPEMGAVLFPRLPRAEQVRIMKECGTEEIVVLRQQGAVLYEGVADTLRALAERYRLYIVSNCQDGYVQAFLHAHGMEPYFADIEMSGRTGRPKGENIRLLMQRSHIDPAQAVYVGDTEGDARAAAAADIPFIWAAYGFGQQPAGAPALERFAELPELLEKL